MHTSLNSADGIPVLGFKRRRLPVVAALAMSLVLGLALAGVAVAKGPVTHSVSAGGPDSCRSVLEAHPGCDGNYSLSATLYADGTVMGQYVDRFARGGGFRAVIDCLVVDGQYAWLSGVITRGSFTDPETGEVFDLADLDLSARLYDGTPDGLPDEISFSNIGQEIPCTDQADFELFEVTEGQVTVK